MTPSSVISPFSERFALAFATCLVASCATAYQPIGFSGGYSDEKVSEDTFFIEFRGNGFTDSGTVMKYLHRRASEVCSKAGYKSYEFRDANHRSNTSATASTNGYGQTSVNVVEKPRSSAMVRCIEKVERHINVQRTAVVVEPSAVPPWYCASTSAGRNICAQGKEACEVESAAWMQEQKTACHPTSRVYCQTALYEDHKYDTCHESEDACRGWWPPSTKVIFECGLLEGRTTPVPPVITPVKPETGAWFCARRSDSERTICGLGQASCSAEAKQWFGTDNPECSVSSTAWCQQVVYGGSKAYTCHATESSCRSWWPQDLTKVLSPCIELQGAKSTN